MNKAMNNLLIVTLFLVLFTGCQHIGRVEFVQVVYDHRELTSTTNAAVIASIQEEMTELEVAGNLTEDVRKGIEDLIARLETISNQAEVIDEWVNATEIDEDLMARLLRARWKEGSISRGDNHGFR